MKMSYSTTKTIYRRANSRNFQYFGWWFLLLGIIFFGGGLIKMIFGKLLVSTVLPARAAFHETAKDIGYLGYWLTNNKKLIEENIALHDLANRSRIFEAQVEVLKQENKDLSWVLNRLPPKEEVAVAQVLTGPDQNPYDTFLIDLGRKNTTFRVSTSSLVTDIDGLVLGRLDQVSDRWSRVYLFSTPGKTVPVVIGTTTIRAVAQGVGGGNFVIDVPHGTEVSLGGIVKLASDPTRILGLIEKITSDQSKTYNHLLVRYPLNIFMIRHVIVHESAS